VEIKNYANIEQKSIIRLHSIIFRFNPIRNRSEFDLTSDLTE